MALFTVLTLHSAIPDGWPVELFHNSIVYGWPVIP